MKLLDQSNNNSQEFHMKQLLNSLETLLMTELTHKKLVTLLGKLFLKKFKEEKNVFKNVLKKTYQFKELLKLLLNANLISDVIS